MVVAQRFAVPRAVVEVEHALRLGGKVWSVMRIHDWYCHGLSASSDSHRRMVAGDIDPQIPSVIACSARSGHDHRDSGNPLSRGGVQAIALTRATWTAVNFGRRPDRFASASDAAPGASHQRRRHLRTVSSHILSHRAICAFDSPAEAASTTLARVTSRCSVRPARVIRVSSRRCEPVNVIRSVLVGGHPRRSTTTACSTACTPSSMGGEPASASCSATSTPSRIGGCHAPRLAEVLADLGLLDADPRRLPNPGLTV